MSNPTQSTRSTRITPTARASRWMAIIGWFCLALLSAGTGLIVWSSDASAVAKNSDMLAAIGLSLILVAIFGLAIIVAQHKAYITRHRLYIKAVHWNLPYWLLIVGGIAVGLRSLSDSYAKHPLKIIFMGVSVAMIVLPLIGLTDKREHKHHSRQRT